jgi:DNA-binding MarR family transcriptional regulator
MADKSPQNVRDSRQSEIAADVIARHLQAISILTRELEKKIADSLGVNLTDLAAMEHLITNNKLAPSELASRLNVSTAASTQIIDRLERAGHVSRERQPDDRRKLFVVPKAESVARTFQNFAPMLDGLDAAISRLKSDDRDVIERFLGLVIDAYQVAINQGNGTSSLSIVPLGLTCTSAKSVPEKAILQVPSEEP